MVPYESMGACDTYRINASVKGQNWGSTRWNMETMDFLYIIPHY